jgi:polyhydroxybutyrate depolymerase
MKILYTLLFILGMTTNIASAQQKTEHIVVDEKSREFITYIPPGTNPEDKLPVIISLHGRLGTAERQMKSANFIPIADREKVIIVCPQGINRSWNDGRATPAHKKGINDVKFINQLISYLINTYHADATRIFVTGMSNGGFMSSRLACEMNNKIAAIAVVAASMDKDEDEQPVKGIPVMYIQGTEDPLVPFNGGMMEKGAEGNIYSHDEVLKKWAAINKCNNKPVISYLPVKVDDGTSIIKEEFSNSSGVRVVGYTIVGGGHIWPGGPQYLPKFVIGKGTKNLDASEEIWAFFKGVK